MAGPNPILLPSVLDRLLDEQPDATRGPLRTPKQSLAALRDAVRRDLEALLNTRRRCLSPPAGLSELDLSIVEYGIPDFLSANMASPDGREQFRSTLEQIIRRFEPRFISLKVELIDDPQRLERTLRFRINAVMYAEPDPEHVVFNSRLDPSNQRFLVEKAI